MMRLNFRLAEPVTQAGINHAEHLGIAVSVAVCQVDCLILSSEGCFGGVGVCGATAEQSVACARAGVGKILKPILMKECV